MRCLVGVSVVLLVVALPMLLDRRISGAEEGAEVAVDYFPGYHPTPRNDARLGKGWTDWDLVKAARPRFPAHLQPKVPLWGYEDESDPAAMAKKIEAAADHGIAAFIFDWYWHEEGPFLDGALEKGFLKAKNRDRLKFSILWANMTGWTSSPPRQGCRAGSFTPGPSGARRSRRPRTTSSGTTSRRGATGRWRASLTSPHDQRVERVDRGELPRAGRRDWPRVPAGHPGGLREEAGRGPREMIVWRRPER